MKRNPHNNFQRPQTFQSLHGAEKAIYLVGIPAMLCFAGYQIYKKKAYEELEQAERALKIEQTYLEKHPNVVKL